MKDAYYYPWLSIWFEPSKTIAYLRDKRYVWFALFAIVLLTGVTTTLKNGYGSTPAPLDYAWMIGILVAGLFVYDLLVYALGKILKGQARFHEVIVATSLSLMPIIPADLISMAGLSISPAIERIFLIWSSILLIAMLAHIEKFGKIKSAIISIAASTLMVFVAGFFGLRGEIEAQSLLKQQGISTSPEVEEVLKPPRSTSSGMGFNNDAEFIKYTQNLFENYEPNRWKRATMDTQTRSWLNALKETNITQDDLDPFFEQIEAIQEASKPMKGIGKKIFESLPYTFTLYLDQKLQQLLDASIEVPLETLYTETGDTIRDMNHSRHFLVSQVYNRIGDFYDDDLHDKSTAFSYVKKGVHACPLNPNTLHMAAYYDDNATANVARYDRVLKLIQKNDTLYDYALSALKNNLGFQISCAGMTKRYDEAIGLLQEAYNTDHDMVFSLATISSIHEERNQTKLAYTSLESEAMRFLGYSDDAIEDLDDRYWMFARQLIDMSCVARDYNVTRYVCNKYLKHHDDDYKTCQDDLKKIEHLPKGGTITPIYSIWDAYLKKNQGVREWMRFKDFIQSLPESGAPSQADDAHFLELTQALYRQFLTDTQKQSSMKKRNEAWIHAFGKSKVTYDDFKPFFSQIAMIREAYYDANGTWETVTKTLPDLYANYFDRKLQQLRTSSIHVPRVTLHTETGKAIRDMRHSRDFFVSQLYSHLGRFYRYEMRDAKQALHYANKGISVSPLNPNTLYSASLYDENATACVARYERVMKLIQKDDALFDYRKADLIRHIGYEIYSADMKERYPEAIRYLQEAYGLDRNMTHALATISAIYTEQNQTIKAYKVLEPEALRFLDRNDTAIKEQPRKAWIFVRRLIKASYAAKDYPMTRYVCDKYLKLHDDEYETCTEALKEIHSFPKDQMPKPLYSVWDTYLKRLDTAFDEALQ